MLAEYPYHRNGDGDRFGRPDQQPRVAGEVPVPGDATELDPEVNPRIDDGGSTSGEVGMRSLESGERAFGDADGNKPDVIGVGGDGHAATVVERHVEFARQAVEIAVIEDVMMKRLRERTDVE